MAASTRCWTAGVFSKFFQLTGGHLQSSYTIRSCRSCHILSIPSPKRAFSPCQHSNRREYPSCPWTRFNVESATKILVRSAVLSKCRALTAARCLRYRPCPGNGCQAFSTGCTLGVAPNKESKNEAFATGATPRQNSDGDINKHGDSISGRDDSGVVPRRRKAEKENIMTVPNLLTTMRMFSSPVLGYLVVQESFPLALGIFAFAGLTDLLDGYIARNFKNQMSILGTALDPLADKLLVSILTISLTAVSLIPVPLTVLIVARDGLLVGACFYIRYMSLPSPKTVSRYFDVTIPSAQLYPTTISKVNTALQLSLVAMTLAAPVFNFVDHPFLQGLWYVTGATTFISGMGYLLAGRDCVKILKDQGAKKD